MSAPTKTMEQRVADLEARLAAVQEQRNVLLEVASDALGLEGKPSYMYALVELSKMAKARKATAEAVTP